MATAAQKAAIAAQQKKADAAQKMADMNAATLAQAKKDVTTGQSEDATNQATAEAAIKAAQKSVDEANAAIASDPTTSADFDPTPGGSIANPAKTLKPGDTGYVKPTAGGDTPVVYPAKGTILRTQAGSKPGTYVEVYADGNGGETTSADLGGAGVIPGSTGTSTTSDRTLAKDTFKNTFALSFGPAEAAKSYVDKLYTLVGNYYKSGSSLDDSYNLALHEAQYNNAIPEFTARFKGLFDLQAKAQAGQAVQVPTIAEFIAAENGMGDVLRSAGMGDLATQDYLGQIIGQGKSVSDVATAINTSFNAIDNAPQAVKDTLASQFPMVDRTTLAKSLLMGADGAAEVQKKVDMATTVTAASQNNMTISDAQKAMLSTSGLSYGQQLQGLGRAGIAGQRGQELSNIYGKTVTGYNQDTAIADQFQGTASAQRARTQLVGTEAANFDATSGTLGPLYGKTRTSLNTNSAGQI